MVSRRGDKGYCVRALGPDYSDTNPDDENTVEPWAMTSDLYDNIAEYYRKNPDPSIQIVEKKADDNENDDSDSDDEKFISIMCYDPFQPCF
jgi:hypothetical protein